ncbi:type VI secretion system lipoprotein TssJ [Snodgrassella communis]|uniref:Type VI secretion system-associated lipoprotein n=1 Tax=Snodgrassella alvi TaxID=1196083 RepID=A0A2N9XMM1_9NEIS|nr:type VI secretion system lipoprotein TssJ [Snodgrassella communis]PIT49576.1 type VI secretion system-associated lipoprotein [Snodgrassella communis]
MIFRFLSVLIFLIGLSSCGLLQQGYEDVRKAGKEAVELKHYHYNLRVVSAHLLNQTDKSQQNTFRMVIYQLRSDDLFNQASYYDLLTNADSVLADELIKKDIRMIYPFDTQEIKGDIDNKTQYLGLVFFFNKPETDDKTWKILVPVIKLNLFRDNYILVDSSQAQLIAKKQVKDLLKQQKQAEKAQKKALKEQEKALKEQKKKEQQAKKAQQIMQEQLDKVRQQGKQEAQDKLDKKAQKIFSDAKN